MLRLKTFFKFSDFLGNSENFPEFGHKFDRILIIQRFERFGRSATESFNPGGHGRWGRREKALEMRDRRGPQPLVHVPRVVRGGLRDGDRVLRVPLRDELAVVVHDRRRGQQRRNALLRA